MRRVRRLFYDDIQDYSKIENNPHHAGWRLSDNALGAGVDGGLGLSGNALMEF